MKAKQPKEPKPLPEMQIDEAEFERLMREALGTPLTAAVKKERPESRHKRAARPKKTEGR